MSFNLYHVDAIDRSTDITPTPESGFVALQSDVDAEQGDMLAVAAQAANLIAAAIGRPQDRVRVNIVGHANPDHAPRSGWTDEFLSVSVYVVPDA